MDAYTINGEEELQSEAVNGLGSTKPLTDNHSQSNMKNNEIKPSIRDIRKQRARHFLTNTLYTAVQEDAIIDEDSLITLLKKDKETPPLRGADYDIGIVFGQLHNLLASEEESFDSEVLLKVLNVLSSMDLDRIDAQSETTV